MRGGPFVEFTGYRPRRPKLTPVSLISTDSKREFGILPRQTATRLHCRGRKSRPLRRAVYKSSFWASTEAQETSHGRSAMINNNCYYARQRLNSNRTLTASCMHSATRRVIHSFIHSFIHLLNTHSVQHTGTKLGLQIYSEHTKQQNDTNLRHSKERQTTTSGKSGPKDQVALHYYYTSPSHWCTTHEVSKL